MKISLCIPQYNRIQYLLKNLSVITLQNYPNIEVVISDDASTDNTEEEIANLQKNYKYPLIYYRHSKNVGYDANDIVCVAGEHNGLLSQPRRWQL